MWPVCYSCPYHDLLENWVSLWTNIVGYQFDYVFDWTALKYPQMSSNNKLVQVCLLRLSLCILRSTILVSFHFTKEKCCFVFHPATKCKNTRSWTICRENRQSIRYVSLSLIDWIHCYMEHWLICTINLFLPVGQEIRDRFTGAVEAFARRNPGSGRHGDHSRHKSLADSFGTSNEAVSVPFSCGS